MAPPVAAIRSTTSWKMPPTTGSLPSAEYEVMNGPTRPAVEVPPRKPYFSTSTVRAPLRAAAVAAAIPAEPPPTTRTSADSSSGTSQERRSVGRSVISRLRHERGDRPCGVVQRLLRRLHAEQRSVDLVAQEIDGAAHLVEGRPRHARHAQDLLLELGVRHAGFELSVVVGRGARGAVAVQRHLHDAALGGQRADEVPGEGLLGGVP